MKKTTLSLVLLASLLASCQKHDPICKNSKIKDVVVVIDHDLTTSAIYNGEWQLSEEKSLLSKCKQIEAVYVLEDSRLQNPCVITVPNMDSFPMSDNTYINERNKAKNRKIKQAYDSTTRFALIALDSFLHKPKQRTFSDVQNSLILCSQIINQSNLVGAERILICTSDLDNNINKLHHKKLEPIKGLPSDLKIKIVRPCLSKDQLHTLFPGVSDIEIYTSTTDLISSL